MAGIGKDGLLERLAEERANLLELVDGLSEGEMNEAPQGEEWSIKDVLAHVASAEEAASAFVRRMCQEEMPRQVPEGVEFELDRWNAGQVRRRRAMTGSQVLEELDQARRGLLEVVEGLSEADLSRRGVHAVWGEIDVRQQLRIVYIHDQLHQRMIGQLKTKVPEVS